MRKIPGMALPVQSITLTPQQISELNTRLADLRHNVNNQLSLIIAATELVRRKPEMAERLTDSLAAPPQMITREIQSFSDHLLEMLQVSGEAPPPAG